MIESSFFIYGVFRGYIDIIEKKSIRKDSNNSLLLIVIAVLIMRRNFFC